MIFIDENIQLKGPNTNLDIQNQINNSTEYNNLTQLNNTNNSQGTGSIQYQLNSMLANTGIEINVDYSDYSNFIHFSSAQTRLEKLFIINYPYYNNINITLHFLQELQLIIMFPQVI